MGADIKPGDRVKVTFEGTWDEENGAGVALTAGVKLYEGYALDAAKSVEKIEPPVEVFKVGDTVRFKTEGSLVFTLGRGGYFDHLNSIWVGRHATFTSEHYEKVSIG